MPQANHTRIIFITGTDTGVGKTLLTALLLCHLRQTGSPALAIKPFCAGSRSDAELLHALQDGELTLDEINPFYFPEPLAPLVAARKQKRSIRLDDVLDQIRSVVLRRLPAAAGKALRHQSQKSKTKTLLVEGAGGLLVPLGENFTFLDLISTLTFTTRPGVIVVARNRLGTINHSLLTFRALKSAAPRSGQRKRTQASSSRQSRLSIPPSALDLVLMDHHSSRAASSNLSSASNPGLLAEWLAPIHVHTFPFLGSEPLNPRAIRQNAKRFSARLARILH